MIRQSDIDVILTTATEATDEAALALCHSPAWLINDFLSNVRADLVKRVQERFPEFDEPTVARVADAYCENVARRIEALANTDWGAA